MMLILEFHQMAVLRAPSLGIVNLLWTVRQVCDGCRPNGLASVLMCLEKSLEKVHRGMKLPPVPISTLHCMPPTGLFLFW